MVESKRKKSGGSWEQLKTGRQDIHLLAIWWGLQSITPFLQDVKAKILFSSLHNHTTGACTDKPSKKNLINIINFKVLTTEILTEWREGKQMHIWTLICIFQSGKKVVKSKVWPKCSSSGLLEFCPLFLIFFHSICLKFGRTAKGGEKINLRGFNLLYYWIFR